MKNAEQQGWPIHVATRITCAEHLEHGDDKRKAFAFGQASSDSARLRAAAEKFLSFCYSEVPYWNTPSQQHRWDEYNRLMQDLRAALASEDDPVA